MHIRVRDYLQELGSAYPNNPLGFVWEFAPVHAWWHNSRPGEDRQVGFLTFHRLVLLSFQRTFPGEVFPADLGPDSLFRLPAQVSQAALDVRDEATAKRFSEDIEGWHNGVHNALGGVFGDPVRNVGLASFWRFHRFIDDQFDRALQTWGRNFDEYLLQVSEADQTDI